VDWSIRVVAEFQQTGTSEIITIDGFYTKEFSSWMVASLPTPVNPSSGYSPQEYRALGGWNEQNTLYPFRIRFAPPKTGVWNTKIKVFVNENAIPFYESPQFSFNVVESGNKGYVYAGKRFLMQSGTTFYPFGLNLPWPSTTEYRDNELFQKLKTDEVYRGHTYCTPRVYTKYKEVMLAVVQNGGNSIRSIMNPISTEIEFEELGNYTSRLSMAQEMDGILDYAKSLGLYIDWNMQIHFTYSNRTSHNYNTNWSWNSGMPGSGIETLPKFCYQEIVGENPIDFLTNADAKKYYKQRLRYILARWGYSTNIALFELFSEIDQMGDKAHEHYTEQNSWKYSEWQKEMAAYIKSQYYGSKHILTTSYAGSKNSNDDSFESSDFDIMSTNLYNYGAPYFAAGTSGITKTILDEYTQTTIKPFIVSETDAVNASCDEPNYIEIKRHLWQMLFSGVAGFYSWEMEKHPQLFPMLGQMKNVFSEFNLDFENDNWYPGSCDLVNATTKEWAFNSTRVDDEMDNSGKKADFIYMRSGNKDFGIGVTTNKTFNIYNQGNDCFEYWWENVCDDCNTAYDKLIKKLKLPETIKTNKEGLKFSEMKANGNFNTYYYHTNDASNSFDYSQTTGASFKIKTSLSPSLNDYIAVVATHRKNQNWLAVNPFSDAELPHDLLDTTTNLAEAKSLQTDIAVNAEEIAQKIEIFPNPFNDNIIIQNNSKEDLVVEFTTIDGKTIKQTTLHERENKINTATLNSGLYLVKITRNGELVLTSKLLKL
jgi:hypothetical protein